LTVPYDKGWSATVDGQKVKITQAQTGFMTIPVKKGAHHIKMTFLPQGFKLGIACFIMGNLGFIYYNKKYTSH
jgi:uncharacterized membrane protein YfhO